MFTFFLWTLSTMFTHCRWTLSTMFTYFRRGATERGPCFALPDSVLCAPPPPPPPRKTNKKWFNLLCVLILLCSIFFIRSFFRERRNLIQGNGCDRLNDKCIVPWRCQLSGRRNKDRTPRTSILLKLGECANCECIKEAASE